MNIAESIVRKNPEGWPAPVIMGDAWHGVVQWDFGDGKIMSVPFSLTKHEVEVARFDIADYYADMVISAAIEGQKGRG